MRYPASEKVEIIELVEQSHLPAKRTWINSAFPARRSTAGMTDIVRAALRRWLTTVPGRIASGIAFPMTSAAIYRVPDSRRKVDVADGSIIGKVWRRIEHRPRGRLACQARLPQALSVFVEGLLGVVMV